MNEERILDKLDAIEAQGTVQLVALTRLQEQLTPVAAEVSDLKKRVRDLEHWKWGLVGFTTLLTTGFTMYNQSKGA